MKSNSLLAIAVIAMVIVAFMCGLYGYMTEMKLTLDDAIYKTLILFVLDGDTSDIPVRNVYINVARFLAPFSLFFGGTQILIYISNNGIKRIRRGLYRNHYVIFGNGLIVKHTIDILRQQMGQSGKRHPIIVIGQFDEMADVDIIDKKIFDTSDFRSLNLAWAHRIISLYEDEIDNVMLIEALCKFLNPKFVDIDAETKVASRKAKVLVRCHSDETEGLLQEVYRHKFGKFGTFKIVEEAAKYLTQEQNNRVLILGLGELGRTLIEHLHRFNSIIAYDISPEKVSYVNSLYADNSDVKCFVSGMQNLDFLQMPELKDISLCYICGGNDNLGYKTALRLNLVFPEMNIIVLSKFLLTDFSILKSRGVNVFNYQSVAMENVLSKSHKVLISVIIPAYNAVRYIEKCLESLSKVSGIGIEFIVVNDGSTDGTLEIIKKFADKDDRFKLINSTHQGVGAARNAGVINAKGTYVAFVDADDMVSPNMFEILYRNALESNADITVCRATSIDENGHIGQPLKLWNFIPGLYDKRKIMDCDFLNNICSPVLWDKLIKREIAQACLSPSLSRGQDFVTLISMIHASNCIRIIEDRLYFYRHHNKSTMAEPLSESTIISDFNTEKIAIELVKKFWGGSILEEKYKSRVRAQWNEIMQDDRHQKFKGLISSKLSEVVGND